MDPIVTVLLYSGGAAATAVFGVLPAAMRRRLPSTWIGWANALAAGLMLGAAYTLMVPGLDRGALQGAAGAALGIGFVYLSHAALRIEDLELNRLDNPAPEYGYQVLLINTLHSAAEGVAIGVAMVLSVRFGGFVAAAIAVHNVAEGAVLATILASRGARIPEAAMLSMAAKVSQVLLAIATFAVVSAAPALLPWTLGFAVGALFYLVMVELLPESYREAGHTTIALVTVTAMGIVVLLGGGPR